MKSSIPTLIAYDGSGSTGGNRFYHTQTQRIVTEVFANKENVKIILWDSEVMPMNRSQLQVWNASQQGRGGTEPAVIAQYVNHVGFKGDLVLITDGQAGANAIDRVSAALGSGPGASPFTRVDVHIIPTGGPANQSVSCPFTRSCPHEVCVYNNPSSAEPTSTLTVTADELAILGRLDAIGTIEEFLAAYSAIEKAIVAATMGATGDPRLRDTILALKKRIQRVDAKAKGESGAAVDLEAALARRDTDGAVAAATTLVKEYYEPAGGEEDPDAPTWSARIARLVSMTEGALRGAFDLSGFSAAIRGDRARRAATMRSAPVEAIQLQEETGTTTTDFECPITCDHESDIVLLITDGKPILEGLDTALTNRLFDCPLNLLNVPELVAALCERLDHPLSLRAFQSSIASSATMTNSPITRRPLMAGGRAALCLGGSRAHAHSTAWTLAQLFTGGKCAGNIDLWYACIVLAARTIPYLADVMPALEAHMKWRLVNSRSSMSLSGLPEFPTTRVPLRTAIWFVMTSPEVPTLTAGQDVIRGHLSHLGALRDLYALADLPPIPARVDAHIQRLTTMLGMLAWVKKDRHTLPALVTALTRAAVETTREGRIQFEHAPQFVPVDGLASAEQQERVFAQFPQSSWCRDPAVVTGLAALVNPSLAAGDIPLSLNWTAPPVPVPTDSWPADYSFTTEDGHIPICVATCRPFYQVTPDKTWKEIATERYRIAPERMLSTNEAHGNFVVKYGAYPTVEELILYLHNRRIHQGRLATLPNAIVKFATDVIESNAAVRAELTPAEFARRFEQSRPIVVRLETERTAAV